MKLNIDFQEKFEQRHIAPNDLDTAEMLQKKYNPFFERVFYTKSSEDNLFTFHRKPKGIQAKIIGLGFALP